MMTRVIAVSVALALLLGGGLGILLNKFVFSENGHEDSAQLPEEGSNNPANGDSDPLPSTTRTWIRTRRTSYTRIAAIET